MRAREARRPITDEELSAFADGRLPPARAARVAAHLRAVPADADRIHAYWRREAALYQAFEPALEEPGPVLPVMPARRRGLFVSTAAIVLVALLVGLLWPGASTPPDLAHVALAAYAESPVALEAVGGSAPVSVPGLDMLGRRHLHGPAGDVTEYRYRRADGARVALYVTERETSKEDGLFRLFARDDKRLVEWHAGGRRFVLVGSGGVPELTRLAVDLRRGFSSPSAVAGLSGAGEPSRPAGPVIDTGSRDGGRLSPREPERAEPVSRGGAM